MAIKERKQITGTEAQIKGYAGHNGVLAYATDTKHLHVLSGTAGTTTKLANMSDIPAPVDISGKADKTYVDTELAKKQAKGDYATNTALTQGLAGKADTSHTHTKSQITDLPDSLDTSKLIPKNGNRESIGGYETGGTSSGSAIIDVTSPDSMYVTNFNSTGFILIRCSTENVFATKVLRIVGDSPCQILGGVETTITWAGGKAPTMKNNMLVIIHYSGNGSEAVVNAIALE